MSKLKILTDGIIKNNPTFVLLLGMCPTLGTTTSAINGMGMGLATAFVLMCSNMAIAALKNVIPDKVRIPCFIVVIAAFVTVLQLLMEAYVPDLYATLGLFIPLIVVNCIILGRAEAFAAKNSVFASLLDGIGIGLGFTLALTVLGAVREIIGSVTVFGWDFIGGFNQAFYWVSEQFGKAIDLGLTASEDGRSGVAIFILAPGAFIALGYLLVLFNKATAKLRS
jgi:electron transport complex protein RnfE